VAAQAAGKLFLYSFSTGEQERSGTSPPAQSMVFVVSAHVGQCGHRRIVNAVNVVNKKSELQFRLTNLAIIYVKKRYWNIETPRVCHLKDLIRTT
jgi:hypothetical protein